MRSLPHSRAGRVVGAILAAIVVLTVAGLIALWPDSTTEEASFSGVAGESERAEVTRSEQFPCPGPAEGTCSRIEVTVADPPAGAPSTGAIELGGLGVNPEVGVGDEVRVAVAEGPPGAPATYTLVDFERRSPILWLALAFAAIVVVFGRLRGALALSGLIVSLAIVLAFIVPAIGQGTDPLTVALIGSFAVMLVTISLAHGLGVKSAAAMLGTAGSLLLVALLASAFTGLAHLTGFSSEEATLLAAGSDVSVQGLLLAGMVIGALGVLDDVTVSQASTVMALRSASPTLSLGELYRRALEVGRDHISATVNTLVLAYAGAALPVLLIFSSGEAGFFEVINAELVAKEIVAMLVGSIGLIAAVPLTTGVTALLASRLPPETLQAEATHAHPH